MNKLQYYLSAFGINNPYIECGLPDHAIYPVGCEVGESIDIDYTSLLLGESFIIEKQALDYIEINKDRLPFLELMFNSLKRLKEEELLDVIDSKPIIEQHKYEIIKKTDALCEDVDSWLRAIRFQWGVLKKDRDKFVTKFGTDEKQDLNSVHFTVANAVFKKEGFLNFDEINRVSKLVTSNRHRFNVEEREYLIEILKPLVAHTVIQDLMRYKTGALVLDWDDSTPFYQNLYKARWDTDKNQDQLLFEAKNLFDVHLPHLKPRNIEQVIRFVRDNKNVRSLRNDILHTLKNGEKINKEWISKYLSHVIKANLQKDKKMRKIRFGGSVAGLLIPGASLLTEALTEFGIAATEDQIEKLKQPSHHWLYALLGE